ncbi:MAG: hypothetical protein NC541_12470 [bacterium]|nr:hypothetical protein [bacterium]
MMETNLSQAVDATNGAGSAYDASIKYLLADKQILSRILKYTVEEFQDMDIQDIMDCIGNDIEIGTRPIDAGLSNLGRVKMTATEDNIPGEGIIYYDIRFTAHYMEAVHSVEREIKILINIEAQRSSDPGKLGYHLENRIVFYLARMISAQKQTEFFHSDFDNLKKVRSIWICMDNDETEDSIEEIGLDRKAVFGNRKNSYHTDLMKAIIVNIRNGKNCGAGETVKKSQNKLIAMLEELVSEKGAAEKKRILADEYGMVMTAELEGRIQIMCNWSESIRERSYNIGITQGITQERMNAIERMMKANATKEQIISYGYTEAEYLEAEKAFYANA